MASGSQPPNMSLEEFHEQKISSIVCIMGVNKVLLGGGCFVEFNSKPWILTAAHVVDKQEQMTIVCVDQTEYLVSSKFAIPTDDLALLEISKFKGQEKNPDDFPCLRLSDESAMVMSRGAHVHLIGHPGRFIYTHNMGGIAVARVLLAIYRMDLGLQLTDDTRYPTVSARNIFGPKLLDDFLDLSPLLPLLQVNNVHGGGRVGGTGAPFLGIDGNIVAIYSFSFERSDYGIHVSRIKKFFKTCQEDLAKEK